MMILVQETRRIVGKFLVEYDQISPQPIKFLDS